MNNYLKPTIPDMGNIMKEFSAIKHPAYHIAEANFASMFCKYIVEMISDFDSKLDNTLEVSMRLVSFGQSIVFAVRSISYYNPSLIVFLGESEENSMIELIQHVSQISFLLMATKRKDSDKPKKPIGFRQDASESE